MNNLVNSNEAFRFLGGSSTTISAQNNMISNVLIRNIRTPKNAIRLDAFSHDNYIL